MNLCMTVMERLIGEDDEVILEQLTVENKLYRCQALQTRTDLGTLDLRNLIPQPSGWCPNYELITFHLPPPK
jgi:hypothetical protein